MKRIAMFSTLLLFITMGCNGQKEKSNEDQPIVDTKVIKEYNDEGNLIKYDSTYSYYYSNIKNDTLLADSIFNEFRNHFNKKYDFSDEDFFNDLFFQDSLLHFDFYKKDFFKDRFRNNRQHLDEWFWQMDSIKDKFFEEKFPK